MSKSKAASLSSSLVGKGGAAPSQQTSSINTMQVAENLALVEDESKPTKSTEVELDTTSLSSINEAIKEIEQTAPVKEASATKKQRDEPPVESVVPARAALISATVKVEEPTHIKLRQYCATTRKTSQEVFTEALQMYFSKYGIK